MRTAPSSARAAGLRGAACGLLLALCSATLVRAAEPIPFAMFSYGAADGLMPPAPLADWWRETVGEAAAWWGAASGAPLDGAAALAHLRSVRVLVSGLPAGDGQLTPVIAGWLREDAPLLGPSLARIAARWPGFVQADEAGASALRGPRAVPPPATLPEPGLRVELDGAGLAEEVRRCMPAEVTRAVAADELAQRVALLARWHPAAGVVPGPDGPRGYLDTGLPERWFKPVDAAVVARLPAGTLSWAAFAIDGAHLRDALAADPACERTLATWLGTLVPLLQPAAVAASLDGTWLVADLGESALLRAPRSAGFDALVAGAALVARVRVPTDQVAVELGDGLFWARSPDEWIIATSPAAIAAWFAAAPRADAAVPGGALVVGKGDHASTSAGIALCDPLLPWEEPLPARARGPAPLTTLLRPAGGTPSAWQQMAEALDTAGDHHLVSQATGGALRVVLDGPLLPWLVPGLAIRWMTDHAQDQEGRVRLRAEIARQRAAGQAALPADLLAALPRIAPDRLALWRAQVAAAGRLRGVAYQADRKRIGEEFPPLPVLDNDRALLAQGATIVADTAALDDPGLPPGSDLDLRAAPASEGAMFYAMPHLGAARALASLGFIMVTHGDAGGVVLCDRAARLLQAPQSMVGILCQVDVGSTRDGAWLVAAAIAQPDRDALSRWLQEPPPPLDLARAWRGERVLALGGAAERWLDEGRSSPAVRVDATVGDHYPRLGMLQDRDTRAGTAGELALMMAFAVQRESGDRAPFANMDELRAPLLRMLLPVFTTDWSGIVRDRVSVMQAKHVLLRLAVRLQLLARDGKLPRTADEARAALGRLDCPYAETTVPLTYQFLAQHAFRLFVSDQVPPPPGLTAQAWQRMTVAVEVPAGRHLIVPGRELEVVVDPRPGPQEHKGADGF